MAGSRSKKSDGGFDDPNKAGSVNTAPAPTPKPSIPLKERANRLREAECIAKDGTYDRSTGECKK